jgi:hypothetical protein
MHRVLHSPGGQVQTWPAHPAAPLAVGAVGDVTIVGEPLHQGPWATKAITWKFFFFLRLGKQVGGGTAATAAGEGLPSTGAGGSAPAWEPSPDGGAERCPFSFLICCMALDPARRHELGGIDSAPFGGLDKG